MRFKMDGAHNSRKDDRINHKFKKRYMIYMIYTPTKVPVNE